MKKFNFFVLFTFVFLAFSGTLLAEDFYGPGDLVGSALQQASTGVMTQLTNVGFKLLFGLSLLKFTIIGFNQVASGEIEMSVGKYAKAFVWLSFLVWLMSPAATPVRDGLGNGANFIQTVINQFLGLASTMTGGGGNSFDAGDILNAGLNASHNLIVSVAKATVGNVGNLILAVALPNVTIFTALMLMAMNILILLTCGYIALKVFMVKIDAAIVITITPLSFALAGLDALKETGLAPFKSMLTIIFRIVILTSIVAAIKIVSDNLSNVLDTNAAGGVSDIWSPITAAIFGYILLAFLAHKSDAVAGAMSSGSSMFGSSDVAGAAAIGAAVGAAVATGGASAAAGAAKGAGLMGDLLKKMVGGGSVTNASPNGSGGQMEPVGDAPQKSSQSLTDAGSSNSAPKESDFTDAGVESTAGGNNAAPRHQDPTPPLQPNTNSGDASSAGIGGGSSKLEESLGKLVDQMSKPKQPTFGERLGAVNNHVAQEKTAVHASVNVNAHDH